MEPRRSARTVAPPAVLVADASGRILTADREAEALFGDLPAGATLADVLPALPDGAPDRIPGPVEVTLRELDGDGTPPLVVAVVRDATERLAVEHELRESRAELERSNARLNEAQRCARMGSWEWEVVEDHAIWSDELYRLLGYGIGDVEPSYDFFLSHVHLDTRAALTAGVEQAVAGGGAFETVLRMFRADGTQFLMRVQGRVAADHAAAPLRMIGVCEDVTERVRAEEARQLLATIVESANDAIFTLDRDWCFTSWNPAAERLYGWTAVEAVGRSVDLILPAGSAERARAREAVRTAGCRPEPFEGRCRRKDGEAIDVSVTMSALRGPDGELTGISAIARDISDRLRTERELAYLADHDALTGLFNRRRFEEELTAACARAGRERTTGALLVLDLDNFKVVNDTFGHGAADELLAGIAGVLRRRARSSDAVARLGGDEFAVLLPRATEADARVVAGDLLRLVREHAMATAGQTVRTTASIGVVLFGGSAEEDPETLVADADRAMYAAKDAGRDRVVVHGAAERTDARDRSRVGWERQIADALEHDRLVLHAQPILDLATGRQDRYELLVRMVVDGEIVPPGTFLSVAERSGQIHAIDRWVVRRAVELLEAHPGVTLEVNLSGATTDDGEMPAFIESLLATHDVDPSALVFEITETAAIGTMSRARELADALGALGCRFALDDFGAGFSSYYYLKRLPADYLKIDGDFIRSPRSETDELIIESIVRIARALGKETIAEYVGDEETVARLRELGVDHAQGFHVGRPLPAEEVLARTAR